MSFVPLFSAQVLNSSNCHDGFKIDKYEYSQTGVLLEEGKLSHLQFCRVYICCLQETHFDSNFL